MADCPHKTLTGCLCNTIILWNKAIRSFCKMVLWTLFTECDPVEHFEVLLSTVYCDLGKINGTGSRKKMDNYSFQSGVLIPLYCPVLEFSESVYEHLETIRKQVQLSLWKL